MFLLERALQHTLKFLPNSSLQRSVCNAAWARVSFSAGTVFRPGRTGLYNRQPVGILSLRQNDVGWDQICGVGDMQSSRGSLTLGPPFKAGRREEHRGPPRSGRISGLQFERPIAIPIPIPNGMI
jgi:hypothetical protein